MKKQRKADKGEEEPKRLTQKKRRKKASVFPKKMMVIRKLATHFLLLGLALTQGSTSTSISITRCPTNCMRCTNSTYCDVCKSSYKIDREEISKTTTIQKCEKITSTSTSSNTGKTSTSSSSKSSSSDDSGSPLGWISGLSSGTILIIIFIVCGIFGAAHKRKQRAKRRKREYQNQRDYNSGPQNGVNNMVDGDSENGTPNVTYNFNFGDNCFNNGGRFNALNQTENNNLNHQVTFPGGNMTPNMMNQPNFGPGGPNQPYPQQNMMNMMPMGSPPLTPPNQYVGPSNNQGGGMGPGYMGGGMNPGNISPYRPPFGQNGGPGFGPGMGPSPNFQPPLPKIGGVTPPRVDFGMHNLPEFQNN